MQIQNKHEKKRNSNTIKLKIIIIKKNERMKKKQRKYFNRHETRSFNLSKYDKRNVHDFQHFKFI